MPREIKDSGARAEYESGMVRDTEEGKARFDLCLPEGIPYEDQMLVRFAQHMATGAKKYAARNWEQANSAVELERYRSSALRHTVQWACGEDDEDHAAAAMFNLMAAESVRVKLRDSGQLIPMEDLSPVYLLEDWDVISYDSESESHFVRSDAYVRDSPGDAKALKVRDLSIGSILEVHYPPLTVNEWFKVELTDVKDLAAGRVKVDFLGPAK